MENCPILLSHCRRLTWEISWSCSHCQCPTQYECGYLPKEFLESGILLPRPDLKTQSKARWAVSPSSRVWRMSNLKVSPATPVISDTRCSAGLVPAWDTIVARQAAPGLKSLYGQSLLLASQWKHMLSWEASVKPNSFWRYSASPWIANSRPEWPSEFRGCPAICDLQLPWGHAFPMWSASANLLKYAASKLHLITDHTWCMVPLLGSPGHLLTAPFGKVSKSKCDVATFWLIWWRSHGWNHSSGRPLHLHASEEVGFFLWSWDSSMKENHHNEIKSKAAHKHMKTAKGKLRFLHRISKKLRISSRMWPPKWFQSVRPRDVWAVMWQEHANPFQAGAQSIRGDNLHCALQEVGAWKIYIRWLARLLWGYVRSIFSPKWPRAAISWRSSPVAPLWVAAIAKAWMDGPLAESGWQLLQ